MERSLYSFSSNKWIIKLYFYILNPRSFGKRKKWFETQNPDDFDNEIWESVSIKKTNLLKGRDKDQWLEVGKKKKCGVERSETPVLLQLFRK